MTVAKWNDAILAKSDDVVKVEGNLYFPMESVNREYLKPSPTRSLCPWKGEAHYFHVVVGEKTNPDAAWHYPNTKPEAKHIKERVAFWKGTKVFNE